LIRTNAFTTAKSRSRFEEVHERDDAEHHRVHRGPGGDDDQAFPAEASCARGSACDVPAEREEPDQHVGAPSVEAERGTGTDPDLEDPVAKENGGHGVPCLVHDDDDR
jgi:hypothetical protein